jgi:hypothetical protein
VRTSHLVGVTIGLVLLGTVSSILGVWTGVTITLWVLLVVSVFWIDRLVERFYPASWPSTTHIRGEAWIARALRAGVVVLFVLLFVLLFALNGFRLSFLIAGVIAGAFGEFSARVFSRRERGGPPAAE